MGEREEISSFARLFWGTDRQKTNVFHEKSSVTLMNSGRLIANKEQTKRTRQVKIKIVI